LPRATPPHRDPRSVRPEAATSSSPSTCYSQTLLPVTSSYQHYLLLPPQQPQPRQNRSAPRAYPLPLPSPPSPSPSPSSSSYACSAAKSSRGCGTSRIRASWTSLQVRRGTERGSELRHLRRPCHGSGAAPRREFSLLRFGIRRQR